MPTIINYGIQSIRYQIELGIKNYSNHQLDLLADIESHINGISGISLSKTNLTDLYRDDFVYDPKDKNMVDIIIDDIKAYRNSTNYGNEFICNNSILQDKFKTFDVRILKLIESLKDKNNLLKLKIIVENYNYLHEMVIMMDKKNLDIPIREMSKEDNLTLNKTKILDLPIIKIK